MRTLRLLYHKTNNYFLAEDKTPLSITINKTDADETAEASVLYIAISKICSNGFSFIHGYFKELLKLQKITNK